MRKADELSRLLAAPRQSREHQSFRNDMIEAQLLGSDGVCRYCVSVLTGIDCFPMDHEEFGFRLARFVASKTCGEIEPFCRDMQALHFLADFMRYLLNQSEGELPPHRRNKEQRAIEMLLKNPSLSDERIRKRLATTLNQMNRWSNYKILRFSLGRSPVEA